MASNKNHGKLPLATEFESSGFRFRKKIPIKQHLVQITGPGDKHLRTIEEIVGKESKIQLVPTAGGVDIYGSNEDTMEKAGDVIRGLRNREKERPGSISDEFVLAALHRVAPEAQQFQEKPIARFPINPRNEHQAQLLDALVDHEIVFGVGPAGTGKTFLAMAVALAMRKKIILSRPNVEAGERLGFLPGTLEEKLGPFTRPLVDAAKKILHDATGKTIEKMLETGAIEILPFAFMRGRDLEDAFIVIDEAQNTTVEQMKMALTRLGKGSRMYVNGDLTQCDLPVDRQGRKPVSGLADAIDVLKNSPNIPMVYFDEKDIVRHPRVQEVVSLYNARDARREAALKPPSYRPG